MVENIVSAVVDLSRRYALLVLALLVLLVAASGTFVASHFSITTDVTKLLDERALWRQREIAFSKAFPQRDDLIVVVIDGTNPADTDLAAQHLAEALTKKTELFRTVSRPDTAPYLRQYGLLLLPPDELADATDGMIKAQPLLAQLAADPSPRGLFNLFDPMLLGVEAGQVKLAELDPLFARVNNAVSRALAQPDNADSWEYLFTSENPGKFELRRFVLAQPVLDYAALSPGEKATAAIREVVTQDNLAQKYNVRLRITGSVPMADEEFASVAEGMQWALAGSVALIVLILYLTLRSWRIIIPILITLIGGLAATTAAALLMVKSLNLISVAFAVMFTGIAVDFGIQFGVRYRDARNTHPDFADALRVGAKLIAVPLLLAALSTAAGFLSFVPTSYRGVAELGLIAGTGMMIAFTLNITVLPALMRFTKPEAETEPMGFSWAKPLDDFLVKHRRPVLAAFALGFAGFAVAASAVPFDFDPLNLKNRKTEAVATTFDLINDPDTTPYTIDVLAPNLDEAEKLAEKIRALPEVAQALTLQSFVPADMPEKQGILRDAANLLSLALYPQQIAPAPAADDIRAAAKTLLQKLEALNQPDESVKALIVTLQNVTKADDATIAKLAGLMREKVETQLGGIKAMLAGNAPTLANIPSDFRKEWVAENGSARIEVYPKGNAHDAATLDNFVKAVQAVAPEATGAPISIRESSRTIQTAFAQAATYSLIVIFIVLLLFLKNLRHTIFVLIPLILGFAFTLGTCTLIHLPVNFANIISLPLLLGLGVSYSIYFVIYWVQGFSAPLQSAMARAVLSSASTAVVAFGSLSLSNHPGTASMGLLLTLSLFYVLFTTFFFLPSLLGKR